MRKLVVVVAALALAGCSKKSKDDGKDKPAPKNGSDTGTGTGTGTAAAPDAGPTVLKIPDALPTSAHAIALEPFVRVFGTVDAQGNLALGIAPKDRKAWPAPTPVPDLRVFEGIWRSVLLEGVAAGEDDAALAKRLADAPKVAVPADQPPPVRGELLDEGGFQLNEGKMGQRSPLEKARDVHFGAVAWSDEAYAGVGNDVPPPAVAVADRTTTTGVPYDGADDDHLRFVVLADAAADARAVIPVLEAVGECALGVKDASGAVARSIVRYGMPLSGDLWIEANEILVDVAATGVTVRSAPGPTHGAAAWNGGQIDATALGSAYHDAVTGKSRNDVVITIAAGVTVQQLVSVSDVLVDGGANELRVRNWTRPELHGPVITMDPPEVQDGTIDVHAIRPAIAAQGAAIKQCYLEALQADAALQGKLYAAIIIGDGDVVKDVVVEGDAPPLVECTKTALKAITVKTTDGKHAAFSVPLRYVVLP